MGLETVSIDTTGLTCPLPLIRLKEQLDGLGAGVEVELLGDDPATVDDLHYWCEQTGHRLLGIDALDKQRYRALLLTGPAAD